MRLLTSLSELRLTAKTPHGEVPYWSKVSTVSAKDILSVSYTHLTLPTIA